jgi:hypothetical protein
MPWGVTYRPIERVVETRYEGVLGPAELRAAVEATARAARENGADRFLADLSLLRDGHSLVDLSELVSHFEAAGLTRSVREALVLPEAATPAAADRARFYETACRNRGWNVRIFADHSPAMAFLVEP